VATAYKAALIVDGVSEQPVEDGVIVIQDENIVSAASSGGERPPIKI
jgi:DNA integrity scanning protein DisA with diadenylate cyclase activity